MILLRLQLHRVGVETRTWVYGSEELALMGARIINASQLACDIYESG